MKELQETQLKMGHPIFIASPAEVFISSDRGCPNGDRCGFCHFPHPEITGMPRPWRASRQRIKEKVLRCFAAASFEEMHRALQEEARQHVYATWKNGMAPLEFPSIFTLSCGIERRYYLKYPEQNYPSDICLVRSEATFYKLYSLGKGITQRYLERL